MGPASPDGGHANSRLPVRTPLCVLAMLAWLAAAVACDVAEPEPSPPRRVLVFSGDQQVGAAGKTLPEDVQVLVLDEQGKPVGGVPVDWSVTEGAGFFETAERETRSEGLAWGRWRLGFSGRNVARAVVTGVDSAFFTAYAVSVPESALAVAGDSQVAIAGTRAPGPLVVRVKDAMGEGVTGVMVRWAVEGGGGVVDPDTSVTDASGDAGTLFLLGDAGPNEASASVEGVAPVPFTALAVAGPTHVWDPLQAVDAGEAHSCHVGPDGKARCWGENLFGQLGAGTGNVCRSPGGSRLPCSPRPLDVVTDAHFVAIVTGARHSCGIDWIGVVLCWGANEFGQLGDGTFRPHLDPEPVRGQLTFRSLSAGDSHTCGITTDGAVYCWGDNSFGQVGLTPAATACTNVRVGEASTCVTRPRPVSGIANARSVAAGGGHSCAVDGAGDAYCWGTNVWGQVGDGTTVDRSVPTAVLGGLSFMAVAAAPGGLQHIIAPDGSRSTTTAHSCGVTVAGDVYCWGGGDRGQLAATDPGQVCTAADGTQRECSPTPSRVGGVVGAVAVRASLDQTCATTDTGVGHCWGAGDPAVTQVPGAGFLQYIAPSQRHACALTGGGVPVCWGSRSSGRLGDGRRDIEPLPFPVDSVTGYRALDVGAHHVCALDTAGLAFCWGSGEDGRLGNGASSGTYAAPGPVAGVADLKGLAVGGRHTCAVDAGGAASCWGDNASGQLGTGGAPASSATPLPVATSLAFDTVVAGADHSCALDTAGAAFCWGGNAYGQLGTGTTTPVDTAAAVAGGMSFLHIAAGEGFTCGVATAGGVHCWGRNDHGELGDGTLQDRHAPQAVPGLSGATAVGAGRGEACALTVGGLWCWGNRESAGPSQPALLPVTGAIHVDVGLGHACIVEAGGAASCWGSDAQGQLGLGPDLPPAECVNDTCPNPLRVKATTPYVNIQAGDGITCAIDADAALHCWGSRQDGRIGDGHLDSTVAPVPVALPGG